MLQVDAPGAFALGQILAWLTQKYLKVTEPQFTHRLMGPVVAYFSLIFAPVGMFLLFGWPGWESMYWWSWIEQSSFRPWVAGFYLLFYLAMILIGLGSYMLGHKLIRKGKKVVVAVLSVVGVVVSLLPFFIWRMTWYHIGTYAEYHAVPRATTTLFRTPSFLIPWAIIIGYICIGTVVFCLWIRRFSNALAGGTK